MNITITINTLYCLTILKNSIKFVCYIYGRMKNPISKTSISAKGVIFLFCNPRTLHTLSISDYKRMVYTQNALVAVSAMELIKVLYTYY